MADIDYNNEEFSCPLFNFEIENWVKSPEVIDLRRVDEIIPKINFIGQSFVKNINRLFIGELEGIITEMDIDRHIAEAFFNASNDLAVIQTNRIQENDITAFMENILLALRIFKEGDVFCKLIWSKNTHILLTPSYEIPNTVFSKIYSLKMEEIQSVDKIFNKIIGTNFKERRDLEIACDRLNRSYGKSMMDEKIVDFMIAFEALFLRENCTNSGTVIATGCSMLLGKNENERKSIYDFMKKTYKLRNDIVHGSAINFSGIDKTAYQLKDYLRKTILLLM